jgi:hypothetical protein
VLVSITSAGRAVVDQATTRRRALIAEILTVLPPDQQRDIAVALRTFAQAAGEVPDSDWPAPSEEPASGEPALEGEEGEGSRKSS